MASKIKKYTYLEQWTDGTERIVIRTADGKFVDNANLTSLRKAPKVSTR